MPTVLQASSMAASAARHAARPSATVDFRALCAASLLTTPLTTACHLANAQLVNRTTFAFIYGSSALAGGLAHYWFGNWAAVTLGSSGGAVEPRVERALGPPDLPRG